jgi:hypothetical protein
MDALIVVAALADTAAVLVHGVVGGRWAKQQLAAVELPTTALFGNADVARRVFGVTWHAVTGTFATCAGALYLMAADAIAHEPAVLRLICVLHVVVLVVGLSFFLRRLDALKGVIPPIFVTCMSAVAVTTWLASR